MERRPLTEGLKPPAKPPEADRERGFVYGPKGAASAAQEAKRVALNRRERLHPALRRQDRDARRVSGPHPARGRGHYRGP
jgi:hypothetical protein